MNAAEIRISCDGRHPIESLKLNGPDYVVANIVEAAQFGFSSAFRRRSNARLIGLRNYLLMLDLLDIFAHCPIDFRDLRQLFTSDRPVVISSLLRSRKVSVIRLLAGP